LKVLSKPLHYCRCC